MAALTVAVTLLISGLFIAGCASTGEIIIEKVIVTGNETLQSDQEFAFILVGGPSELNEFFTVTNGQPYSSGAIIPGGGYSTGEIVPAGWDLTSATCDDGSPVDNIDVAPGEIVTCIFENTKLVDIVLFTDFQCGTCEKLHSEVEGELLRLYVDTGKAYLEVRLLSALGDDSLRAAEAALCATDQELFWEYRDAIFAQWLQTGEDAYSEVELRRIASELGLNEQAFSTCLQSGAKRAEVDENMRQAAAAGISGMPTVFINGVEVEEDELLSLESYINTIEDLLSRQ